MGRTRRGRPAKPSYLKVLQGTERVGRKNEKEPKLPAVLPEPPEFLQKDEIGIAEWHDMGGQLLAIGAMTRIDRTALAAYCVAYSTWVDACTKVMGSKRVWQIKKTGYPMQNPYLSIANKAFDQMTKMLVEFGMTPSSRTKVRVGESNESGDDFDKFLNGEVT